MADKMTLEKFEEPARSWVRSLIRRLDVQSVLQRTDRKQGISETGKYAEDRRFQSPWGLLQDQHLTVRKTVRKD